MMRDWLCEVLIVVSRSGKTQWAIALGLIFFFGILLLGEALVGSLELHGALQPLTAVVKDGLFQRYDRAAFAALGGFFLMAIKAYRVDRRRLLGL